MKKNRFIAFEGIDGSGKSTQVKLLAEKLKAEGYKVYTTAEPTDGPIGTMIRKIMKTEMQADERTIAALFVADRLEHILNKANGILKMLDEGYTVITDRYYFSSYAYHGTHIDMNWVIQANSICAELLRPGLTIYIDSPPEVSMTRINSGRTSTEHYETTENLSNVRNKYLEAFALLKDKETIFTTDGNRSAELVAADIWNQVSQFSLITKAG
jgi:dTMP kinase